MGLERQYGNLVVQHQTELDQGIQRVQKILKAGKTVEDARKFLETPTGKAVKKGVKAAFVAAKVAVAFKTGGASKAATVGASLAVRTMQNHYTNVGV